MCGEEKEKEDISRLDGDEDIKVRTGGPEDHHSLFTAGKCNSEMTVNECVSLMCVFCLPPPENIGGAAGAPQGGSSEAAQPPPR